MLISADAAYRAQAQSALAMPPPLAIAYFFLIIHATIISYVS